MSSSKIGKFSLNPHLTESLLLKSGVNPNTCNRITTLPPPLVTFQRDEKALSDDEPLLNARHVSQLELEIPHKKSLSQATCTAQKIKGLALKSYHFVTHPVTSSVIMTAATGGMVASILVNQILAAGFCSLALGYSFQNIASFIANEVHHKKQGITDETKHPNCITGWNRLFQGITWINKVTSFEVAGTISILIYLKHWNGINKTLVTNCFNAALVINAFFVGSFVSKFFKKLVEDKNDTIILLKKELYQAKPNTSEWTTSQKIKHFFSENKEVLIMSLLGIGFFCGGISNLFTKVPVEPDGTYALVRSTSPFMYLQEYGVQLIGMALGHKLQQYNIHRVQQELHNKGTDNYKELSWSTKLFDKIMSLQQAVIGLSAALYGLPRSPRLALLPLLPLGMAIGANYEQQKQIYRIEESMSESKLEQDIVTRQTQATSTSKCRSITEYALQIIVTAGCIIGGYFVINIKNNYLMLGPALIATPIFYHLAHFVERRPGEWRNLKYVSRFLLEGAPIILESQFIYWNTQVDFITLYSVPNGWLPQQIVEGIIAGLNWGTFRRTITHKRFSKHQQWQHGKAGILTAYFIQAMAK